MLGCIAGDIIGSVHEEEGTKTKDFPLFVDASRFTDDTVLTVAVADCLLNGGDYVDLFRDYFHQYPTAGFGMSFILWAGRGSREPYGSFGNGSAMRVAPVGVVGESLAEVLSEARQSSMVTHNHPVGVRGAEATAVAVFLARHRWDKSAIKSEIESRFGYDLSMKLDDIREDYRFDVSCQGSVPQSIISFLESESYEDAIRNAISLGGDTDTMACIAGGIAEAYYGGVPKYIRHESLERLTEPLRAVVNRFYERYGDRLTGSL